MYLCYHWNYDLISIAIGRNDSRSRAIKKAVDLMSGQGTHQVE